MSSMETPLCTVPWYSAQNQVGFGVLAAEVRRRGLQPKLVLNALEYYSVADLEPIWIELINAGKCRPVFRVQATAEVSEEVEHE